MKTDWLSTIVLCVVATFWASPMMGDSDGEDDAAPDQAATSADDGEEEDSDEDEVKTIAEVVGDSRRYEGLFVLYQDPEDGKVWMEIKRGQLGREFIYFGKTTDGVADAGALRGQFRETRVLRLARHFNRLEWIEENTSFYHDPDSALSGAAAANISPAVLASLEIVAEEEDRILVEAGGLFLRETFSRIDADSGDEGGLGELAADRTKFLHLASYPENTEVEVEYVYQNNKPKGRFGEDVTDPRILSLRIRHSFLAMPENDYRPRRDDPRVGYFMTKVTDLTSPDPAPWRDMIHRWHLVKRKPGADLSEPVEPIVWWMENTTPVKFRDTIRDAALRWNEAFEKIGFKNAVVIRQQPDDADWEADDVRYNVIRWTSSPSPWWGGYGPSFVNPRTGQILGSNVMLEYSFLSSRPLRRQVFEGAGLSSWIHGNPDGEWWNPPVAGDSGGRHADCRHCAAGSHLALGFMAGREIERLREAMRPNEDQLVRESLYYLVLHELGHTLGLSHNFKASQLHDPESIHNPEITRELGVTSSVMEYPSVNLAPLGTEQGQYFTTGPGPYDYWAIEYGYSEGLEDPVTEERRLEEILSRSTEPALMFGNDADDMRSPGKGIDPRAMTFSLSSDPVRYGEQRCELMRHNMDQLLERGTFEGRTYESVRKGYLILTSEMERALHPISRYIGGVYVERVVVGQEGAGQPLTPVPGELQRRAMAVLARHAFAADAFELPEGLAGFLQPRRRGWDFGAEGEDPKLHDRVLRIQGGLLAHLLHPHTQGRILDTELYGNDYPLSEMMTELTDAIVDSDPEAASNGFRRNLQLDLVRRLLNLQENDEVPPTVRSVVLYEIRRIEGVYKERAKADLGPVESAHAQHVLHKIRRGLDESGN